MILCDTNVIIEVLKNNPSVTSRIEEIGLGRIAISVVTAMELYYGALNKAELGKIKRHLSSVRIFLPPPIFNEPILLFQWTQ